MRMRPYSDDRVTGCDRVFAQATQRAAEAVNRLTETGYRLRERPTGTPPAPTVYLEVEMARALEDVLGQSVAVGKASVGLPNWDPQPGKVDLAFETQSGRCCVAEAKVHKTDETLWDLLKMIDAQELERVEASYLVVAASEKQWAKEKEACTEIFQGLDQHLSLRLFEDNARAWWALLWGGRARPTSIPARASSRVLADVPITVDDRKPGRLKCVAVGWSRWTPRVPFEESWHHGNWPLGTEPGEEYTRQPPKTGAGGKSLRSLPAPREGWTDREYLRLAPTLPQRSLAELGWELVEGDDAGERLDSWQVILDGPSALVTSSSGMYLRCHSHHLAIGDSLEHDEVDCGRVFVALRLIRSYAGGGREGYLETLYRGLCLDDALDHINSEFMEWRDGEHGVERQPHQEMVARGDFERAFRGQPDVSGEARTVDALAYELLNMPMQPPPQRIALRHVPYRGFP